jgi:hypothetical protein
MLIAVIFLGILYVTAAFTPSHFSIALAQLGFKTTGLIAGTAQGIRSDDFFVATPLLRNVVENSFGPIDMISPYRESFRSFIATPLWDWSLIFKPQLWGFFILSPAYALSLYFFFFYAAFFLGYTLLSRRFEVPHALSVIFSLLLLSSQLPQVWWTQNAPIYAFAPWPLLVFLSHGPWFLRVPGIAYTVAVWLFGELYPPPIIGNAFAWIILVLAFAREELAPHNWLRRLAPALLGLAIGIGTVWLYFIDLIPIMQNTIYPGQRISSGGGVSWLMILAHAFPNITTLEYQPILTDTNVCEIGVVGSYFPLIFFMFADYGSLLVWLKQNRTSAIIWGAGLALMLSWMVLPLPATVGIPFLWHRVPGIRMLWGFGLLLTFGLAIVACHIKWKLNKLRIGVFTIFVLVVWFVSKTILIEEGTAASAIETSRALQIGFADLVVLVPIAITALIHYLRPLWTRPRLHIALALSALFSLVLTFGRFNPIQSAHAIFTHDKTRFLEAAAIMQRANPKGWLAIPGGFGQTLNAFGISAINHTLLQPQLSFFRGLYPNMPDEEFNQIFNRYANVLVDFEAYPSVPRPDVVSLPIFDVGTPVSVERLEGASIFTPRGGEVVKVVSTRINYWNWRVVVIGWAPFAGIDHRQKLGVAIADGFVVSARAVRLISTSVGDAVSNRSYDTAGFALEITGTLRDSVTSFPISSLIITATDQNAKDYRLAIKLQQQ